MNALFIINYDNSLYCPFRHQCPFVCSSTVSLEGLIAKDTEADANLN
jgi:hypothetical protein